MKTKNKIFKYPDEIYNEDEVLEVYKNKFPKIVKEYERVVKETYLSPVKYKQIVKKKSKNFDKKFKALLKEYKSLNKSLRNLIEFDIKMHRNYAFNFWLISYAINDGPVALHYAQKIEKILEELFDNKEKINSTKSAFLQTDFEIFYHKIIKASVEIYDLLNKFPNFKKLLGQSKQKNPAERRKIWDKVFKALTEPENKRELKELFKKWRWVFDAQHKELFYTIMDEAVDNYQQNCEQIKELKQVKKTIEKTISLADQELGKQEGEKLRKLYLLIKYMLWAKDSEFGEKDPKLLPFWSKLTQQIISQFEQKYNKKVAPEKQIFLWVPWSLENFLNFRVK